MALIILLFALATSKCVDFEPNNPSFYCDDIVTWPISEENADNSFELSKRAFELYYDLKTRYLERGEDEDHPALECLAVARKFYCSYQYPYCVDESEPERGVCDFLCDIWSERCPEEPFKVFCEHSEGTDCSFSAVLALTFGLLIVLV